MDRMIKSREVVGLRKESCLEENRAREEPEAVMTHDHRADPEHIKIMNIEAAVYFFTRLLYQFLYYYFDIRAGMYFA